MCQGDAVSGLTLAVAGVGPAGAAALPLASWPDGVGESDAWAVAVDEESNWYALISQDCDIVSSAADEPTVLVAPLVLVTEEEWADLKHNAYSARRWAYPGDSFNLPAGAGLAIDLAWSTSVLKGSLHAAGVLGMRPLTGPQREDLSVWLGARLGRVPFPDDVVDSVLDPCYDVRRRLVRSALKAEEGGGTAKLEARVTLASKEWYARVDGKLVHVLGALTGTGLQRAGFVLDAGVVDQASLDQAVGRLEAEIIKRMNKVDPHSGFSLKVQMIDLARVPAADFKKFAPLIR